MKELEIRIRKLLLKVGVDPADLGYKYLVDAILFCYEDDTYSQMICKKLYPAVAEKHKTTTMRAERNIRHAIERAVDSNPNIADVLLVAPSGSTGKYANSTFIALCVEALRMEEAE